MRKTILFVALTMLSTVSAAADSNRLAEYAAFALTHDGDVDAGKKVFNETKRAKCVTCHKTDGRGGEVGPDLTSIGAKFDRPHLIESILEPSRQIVEGFQTSTLLMDDGRVLTGVIREESDRQVVIYDAENRSQRVDLDEVEERQINTVSIMPADLMDELSPQEFTDLIAYLETLGTGGKMKPGAGVIGRIGLPQGFAIESLVTALDGVTAMETLPDGRVLLCEQVGRLRVVKDGELLDRPMLNLNVVMDWERGLIGVTVDPQFPNRPYIYVCYVWADRYTHHRVSRFTVTGDVAGQ